MAMTVKKRKDSSVPRVIMHRVADIRGGVSVAVSDLGGDYLPEGTVLSKADSNGICHVVKVATVAEAAAATDKTIKVKKNHNFKVGDFVMSTVGAKAYAITAIDSTNKDVDTLTVKAAVGAMETGAFLMEATAESTDTASALKYEPQSIVGTGKPVIPGTNLDTDAWVIAVTKGNDLPVVIQTALKGIINY